MTDLRDRMRIYDQAPAPDYWNEVELRASARSEETAAPARSARALLLLAAAAMLLALAVGGAALALSRLVDPPPDSSVTHLAYGLDGDIYLADADGQNPVRIADGEPFGEEGECSSFEGPMWSPDGRYLAYRSFWQAGCSGSVYLSDAEGHPVASFPGTGWLLSWSPDSTRVATWVELFETVGIYGIDGDRQALLSAPPGCVGPGDHDPLWSPDGRSVVAAGCEMPIDGQTPRRLSEDDPRSRSDWAYSPDGTRVAYASYTEGVSVRTGSLVIADANGMELQVLTYRNDWDDPTGEVVSFGSIVWSPLGDRVAYLWRSLDNSASLVASELRVLDIASGEETTIAAEPGIGGPLAYSPEGDRILHLRDVDGEMGLWSITVAGSDAQLLVPGADSGDWQPLPPSSALPSTASEPSATPTIQDVMELEKFAPLEPGTYFIDPDSDPATPLRVVYEVPVEGWSQWFGALKFAGDGHVAINITTVVNLVRHGCRDHSWADPPVGPSVDDLAAALADLAPFRVTSAPTNVTMYGYAGKYLELTVPDLPAEGDDFTGCVDGNLLSWVAPIDVAEGEGGAFHGYNAEPVEEFWILNVDGTRLVIEANWSPASPPEDVAEMRAILGSIRVEP